MIGRRPRLEAFLAGGCIEGRCRCSSFAIRFNDPGDPWQRVPPWHTDCHCYVYRVEAKTPDDVAAETLDAFPLESL